MRFVVTLFLLAAAGLSSHAGENQWESKQQRGGQSATARTKSADQQDSKETKRSSPADRSRDKSRDADTRPRPTRKETRTEQPETDPRESSRKVEPAYPPTPENEIWQKPQNLRRGTVVQKNHKEMFDNVRTGLNEGRIGSFSEHLAPQVHINLRGGESGYFSSSQAYYVLENYLQTNRFSSFEFTTMEQSGETPYATGKAEFDQKGRRESAQVYVSLTQVGERWVISQIKIY